MQQTLDQALQYVNFLLQTSKQQPSQQVKMKGEHKLKTMQQKLLDLYLEEGSKSSQNKELFLKELFCGSNLLEKLLAKEKFNCLVINLYPGNEGYSLMLKTRTGNDTETIRLPYEENELLSYIDNEELPPILVDLLERSQSNVFYSGCVIVEVRDYRRSSNPASYACHHVLLRPTTQTLVAEVSMLTNDGQKWSAEDRNALEAALLLTTSEPLCLDPSVSVSLLANRLQYRKRYLANVPITRMAKKHTQAAINRKRKLEHCAAPPNLKLYDFIAKRKNKLPNQAVMNVKLGKQSVDSWKQKPVQLSAPEKVEVLSYAKTLERVKSTDNSPVTSEEFILETDSSPGRSYAHITILQRPVDEHYSGKLVLDREGPQSGNSCSFPLGTKLQAQKYVNQFKHIFTKEGRKSVKITHIVPGQQPKVTCTPGIKENEKPGSSPTSGEYSESQPPPAKKSAKQTPTTTQPPPVSSAATTTTVTSAASSFSKNTTSPISSPVGGNQQLATSQSAASRQQISSTTVTSATPVSTTGISMSKQTLVCDRPNSTPPASLSPSVTRRASADSGALVQLLASLQQQVPASASGTDGASLDGNAALTVPRPASADATLSSSAGITANVNLTSLGLAQNLGLHNIVSLTGMGVSQGIAVPISLTVMSGAQPTLMTSGGMIVSSVPHNENTVSVATGSSTITSVVSSAGSDGLALSPRVSASVTTSSTSLSSPAVIVSSGVVSSASSALSSPQSMLSLPIGVTGSLRTHSLAHIMASGLKTGQQNMRATTPVSLLQVSGGQQTIPLIAPVQRPISQVTRGSPSNMPSSQGSSKQRTPSGGAGTTSSVSPSVSVASSMVTLTSQQQIQIALQKQHTQQLQQQLSRQHGTAAPTKSKSKRKNSSSSSSSTSSMTK